MTHTVALLHSLKSEILVLETTLDIKRRHVHSLSAAIMKDDFDIEPLSQASIDRLTEPSSDSLQVESIHDGFSFVFLPHQSSSRL